MICLMIMIVWIDNYVISKNMIQNQKVMQTLSDDLDSIYINHMRFKEDDLDEVVRDMDNQQYNFEDLQQLLDTLNSTNTNSQTKS